MNLKKIFKGVLFYLLIVLSSFILSLTHYLITYFNTTYLEQLLYNLLNMQSLNIVTLEQSITTIIFIAILLIAIFSLPFLISCFTDKKISIHIKKKELQLFPFSLKKFSLFLFIISIVLIFFQIGTPKFIFNQFSTTNLYEKYYVEYQPANVTFPDNKQNLIMIYVESFENSSFQIKNGGTLTSSYTPNMEKLALTYTNFSNSNKLGGFKKVNGTNWTIAGLVAQTAGVPIYIHTKGKNQIFLEGATSLGDILEENGYQNYFMLGSDSEFADRKNYFTNHGHYQIYDYQSARKVWDIPYNYYNWWGYEDKRLYELAKKKLENIAKQNTPFNFTMLTADTHYFDGYTDKSCPQKFKSAYANSYYCMDQMLAEFISWLQEQDFYQNTTIIVVGDHLTMRDDFYQTNKDYERTVFNLFINSRITTENTKNRIFTAFDIFPTTLASIGAEIKGNRLALGTNLFSNQKTLAEELGYQTFASEIQKKSIYYQSKILK